MHSTALRPSTAAGVAGSAAARCGGGLRRPRRLEERVGALTQPGRLGDLQDCVTAVGAPLGTPEYIAEVLDTRASQDEGNVEALVRAPLSVEAPVPLLRTYFSVRMPCRP